MLPTAKSDSFGSDDRKLNASMKVAQSHIASLLASLEDTNNSNLNEDIDKIQTYSDDLIHQFQNSLSDRESEFKDILQSFKNGSMRLEDFENMIEAERRKDMFTLELAEDMRTYLESISKNLFALLKQVQRGKPIEKEMIREIYKDINNAMTSVMGVSRIALCAPQEILRAIQTLTAELASGPGAQQDPSLTSFLSMIENFQMQLSTESDDSLSGFGSDSESFDILEDDDKIIDGNNNDLKEKKRLERLKYQQNGGIKKYSEVIKDKDKKFSVESAYLSHAPHYIRQHVPASNTNDPTPKPILTTTNRQYSSLRSQTSLSSQSTNSKNIYAGTAYAPFSKKLLSLVTERAYAIHISPASMTTTFANDTRPANDTNFACSTASTRERKSTHHRKKDSKSDDDSKSYKNKSNGRGLPDQDNDLGSISSYKNPRKSSVSRTGPLETHLESPEYMKNKKVIRKVVGGSDQQQLSAPDSSPLTESKANRNKHVDMTTSTTPHIVDVNMTTLSPLYVGNGFSFNNTSAAFSSPSSKGLLMKPVSISTAAAAALPKDLTQLLRVGRDEAWRFMDSLKKASVAEESRKAHPNKNLKKSTAGGEVEVPAVAGGSMTAVGLMRILSTISAFMPRGENFLSGTLQAPAYLSPIDGHSPTNVNIRDRDKDKGYGYNGNSNGNGDSQKLTRGSVTDVHTTHTATEDLRGTGTVLSNGNGNVSSSLSRPSTTSSVTRPHFRDEFDTDNSLPSGISVSGLHIDSQRSPLIGNSNSNGSGVLAQFHDNNGNGGMDSRPSSSSSGQTFPSLNNTGGAPNNNGVHTSTSMPMFGQMSSGQSEGAADRRFPSSANSVSDASSSHRTTATAASKSHRANYLSSTMSSSTGRPSTTMSLRNHNVQDVYSVDGNSTNGGGSTVHSKHRRLPTPESITIYPINTSNKTTDTADLSSFFTNETIIEANPRPLSISDIEMKIEAAENPLLVLHDIFRARLGEVYRSRLLSAALIEASVKSKDMVNRSLSAFRIDIDSLIERAVGLEIEIRKTEEAYRDLSLLIELSSDVREQAMRDTIEKFLDTFGQQELRVLWLDLYLLEYRGLFEAISTLEASPFSKWLKSSHEYAVSYKSLLHCQSVVKAMGSKVEHIRTTSHKGLRMNHTGVAAYRNNARLTGGIGGGGVERDDLSKEVSSLGVQLSVYESQTRSLETALNTANEELKEVRMELFSARHTADRTPGALLFFAALQEDRAVDAIKQLVSQLNFMKSAGHVDLPQLSKRIQVCLTCVPDVEKFVIKFTAMYHDWTQSRIAAFRSKGRVREILREGDGALRSITICPTCHVDPLRADIATLLPEAFGAPDETSIASPIDEVMPLENMRGSIAGAKPSQGQALQQHSEPPHGSPGRMDDVPAPYFPDVSFRRKSMV
eukprot:gene3436-6818_t